jgi:hypothetical protein
MTSLRKLADRFTDADIDNEIVIMRLDDGTFYALSGTAVTIWRLIDGKRDKAALITSAASAYGAVEDDIAADIDELLAQLKEAGLLADD